MGWCRLLGAVLNSFSLIVWKTEDLQHARAFQTLQAHLGRNAWHFQVPEIPFSADLTKAKGDQRLPLFVFERRFNTGGICL